MFSSFSTNAYFILPDITLQGANRIIIFFFCFSSAIIEKQKPHLFPFSSDSFVTLTTSSALVRTSLTECSPFSLCVFVKNSRCVDIRLYVKERRRKYMKINRHVKHLEQHLMTNGQVFERAQNFKYLDN